MKPTPHDTPQESTIVAFGAHPDDIEFGCGGVIARETQDGRSAHFVVCSCGEAGTHGTPEVRVAEATDAARLLGATIEFVELDGDAHLEIRAAHAIRLAAIIRHCKPRVVLSPSLVQNQHPDHWRLATLVRDATRFARYGGLAELKEIAPHTIEQLFYYALGPEAEPRDITPMLVDISPPQVVEAWTTAMRAHASQVQARNYIDLQLSRARQHGLRAGLEYAMPLFPNDPLVLDSLAAVRRAARRF